MAMNMQVLIKAETRLVLGVGRPLPGKHNACTAVADSGIKSRACGPGRGGAGLGL